MNLDLSPSQNNTAFTAPRKAITIEDDNEEDRGTGSGGGARMVKEFHGGVQKEYSKAVPTLVHLLS